MNFDEIQNAWHSSHNQPSPAQRERDRVNFLHELRRRHRGAVLFMALLLAGLTVLTSRVAWHLLRPDPAKPGIDLSQEWSLFLLLSLPWLGLAMLYLNYRRHRRRHPDYERSIPATLHALLGENTLERARYRWIAALNGAVLLLVPLFVAQLRATGKAGSEILVPAYVILPTLMLGIFLAMLWRYRRVLLPQKRQLEALLETYRDA